MYTASTNIVDRLEMHLIIIYARGMKEYMHFRFLFILISSIGVETMRSLGSPQYQRYCIIIVY